MFTRKNRLGGGFLKKNLKQTAKNKEEIYHNSKKKDPRRCKRGTFRTCREGPSFGGKRTRRPKKCGEKDRLERLFSTKGHLLLGEGHKKMRKRGK